MHNTDYFLWSLLWYVSSCSRASATILDRSKVVVFVSLFLQAETVKRTNKSACTVVSIVVIIWVMYDINSLRFNLIEMFQILRYGNAGICEFFFSKLQERKLKNGKSWKGVVKVKERWLLATATVLPAWSWMDSWCDIFHCQTNKLRQGGRAGNRRNSKRGQMANGRVGGRKTKTYVCWTGPSKQIDT